VNTCQPKPETPYQKNTEFVGDFWQQVAKFVFNVSNLLFSQHATDRRRQAVVIKNLRLGSPLRDPFFDPSPPFFGF